MTENERIARVREAVAQGKITEAEADAYLRSTCDTTWESVRSDRKRSGIILIGLLIAPILAVLAAMLLSGGSPTGLLILDIPQENATNSTILINESFTGVNVSGILYGDGTAEVYLDTPAGTLLVANISSDSAEPRTTKASYALGEEVILQNAPQNATHYFDDGTSSLPIGVPFNASGNGTLLIVANDSDALTTYRLPIIIGDAVRQTVFESICIETCALAATNGTVRIITTGDAMLEITRVEIAALAPNRAPQLAIAIPAQTINGTATIDLDLYFVDPDGDSLIYDTGSSDLVNATISGTTLTMMALQTGNGTLTIYASDLQELIQASIGIVAFAPADEQNGSANITLNETTQNATLNTSIPGVNVTNETNATLPESNTAVALNATDANATGQLDCSSTNPNLRPTECLLLNATALFPDQDIFWEDLDRRPVAKFTIIGNLLLRGDVVQGSTGSPGPRDFRIGYPDQDGNIVPTIWIDGQTGDLHLHGTLQEETLNMQPPPGSYSVLTKRSIYLAYADPNSGDLYIRGNIIPYRRSIE